MKKTIPLLAILMVELCSTAPLFAATVRTATESFVTNKIAAAISQIPPPDFSTNNVALVATIEATAPAPGDYAAVSNAAMAALSQEQFDTFVSNDLIDGGLRVMYAHDSVYSEKAQSLWRDYDGGEEERSASAIFSQLDAATATNAQQTAALANKLDKSGGTMTGEFQVGALLDGNFQVVPEIAEGDYTPPTMRFGDGAGVVGIIWRLVDGCVVMDVTDFLGTPYRISLPSASGTLALSSDIPTSQLDAATATNAQQTAALAGKASTADATLTERFSAWTCEPATDPYSGAAYEVRWWNAEFITPGWYLFAGGEYPADTDSSPDYNATTINFTGNGVIATRTALPGYQLGSQTDKPLASLSSLTSLVSRVDAISSSAAGKQDKLPYPTNAIPYAAITGAPVVPSPSELSYALGANTTASAKLADRTNNLVAPTSGSAAISLTFPDELPDGRSRDFTVLVALGAGFAGSVAFTVPTGATIYGDGFAASVAPGESWLYSVTEIASNAFLVAEQKLEVAE